MPVYTCQRCFKIFKQKSHYIRHQQRKYPCDDKNPLEKMVEKVIHNMNNNSQEKMDNNVTPTSSTSSTSSLCNTFSKSISYHSPLQLLDGKDVCILHEDCMTSLQSMEDNSIDCVITDPPYFIDKLDNAWSSKNIEKDKKNSHIKHLPKGMKFSKNQVKSLYDYYLELAKVLMKKMKPGGYFLSFSSPRLYHAIAMSCEIAGFEIRDMINWTYTQTIPKGMSVSHIIEKMNISAEEKESLIHQYRDFKTPQIKSCFEPICVAMKPIGKLSFIKNELQYQTGLLDFSQKVGENEDRVPANIMITEPYNELYNKNFMVPKPSKKEKSTKNTHITVKPLALMEHLVRLFSKKGAIVIDPFVGSGTTALACKQNGRKCIGYEINEEYVKICRERLTQTGVK